MGTMSTLYGLLKRTDAWRFRTWAFAASLVFLLAAIFGYLSLVAPLQRQIFAEQIRSAARGVDSIISLRSATVATAGRVLDLENAMSENGGTQALNALRDQFPDFLSLEVLNEDGALLAMFGDVSLSEAKRKSRAEDPVAPGSLQGSFTELFRDHPQENCFFITAKQTTTDGNTWFVRARFSREPIEKALTAFNEYGIARLEATSSLSSDWANGALAGSLATSAGEFPEAPSVTVSTSWRSREARAAAGLVTPGWAIIVKGNSTGLFLARYLAVVLGTLVLVVLAQMLARRGPYVSETSSERAVAERPSRTPPASTQPPDVSPQPAFEPAVDDTQGQETFVENESPAADGNRTAAASTPEIELPAFEEASDTIPEFLEVAWVEPDVQAESPRKRQDDYACPSLFAGS